MSGKPFFHAGMRDLQDRFDGRRVADATEAKRKHYSFADDERQLIEAAPFFFVATAWNGYVDCSIKSGDPGFVRIVGPGSIEYPKYDGNSMYRTLGNISMSPSVGLLFVRFDGPPRKFRINGEASIVDDPAVLETHFGAKLVVRIECEIYPNCPRYLTQQGTTVRSRDVPRRADASAPVPDWKRLEHIRGILPNDDPHRDRLPDGPAPG